MQDCYISVPSGGIGVWILDSSKDVIGEPDGPNYVWSGPAPISANDFVGTGGGTGIMIEGKSTQLRPTGTRSTIATTVSS